ncbi:MAG: hypothetical protein ACREPZ_10385 [Rhodanobacteraceae bacterium]
MKIFRDAATLEYGQPGVASQEAPAERAQPEQHKAGVFVNMCADVAPLPTT